MNLNEAIALIGTSWEKNGERVTFIGIRCLPTYTDMLTTTNGEAERWVCIEYWEGWLDEADVMLIPDRSVQI
jgi:hypothetical protein